MKNENKHEYWTSVLYRALDCGLYMVLYFILAQWVWNRPFSLTGLAPCLILSILIYLCQRDIMRNFPDMNFSGLFFSGLAMGAASSLIVDLYAMIYIKIYNPEIIEQAISQSTEMVKEMYKFQNDELNNALSTTRKLFLPILMISNTIIYSILSSIFSVFGAFLIKRHTKNNTSK